MRGLLFGPPAPVEIKATIRPDRAEQLIVDDPWADANIAEAKYGDIQFNALPAVAIQPHDFTIVGRGPSSFSVEHSRPDMSVPPHVVTADAAKPRPR